VGVCHLDPELGFAQRPEERVGDAQGAIERAGRVFDTLKVDHLRVFRSRKS